MKRTIQAVLMVCVLSMFAGAQTKISGTVKCGKPDKVQQVDVGDKPGHAFAISQGNCTWTKPISIAGTQTKDDVDTNALEILESGAKAQGYVVGTLANGDKLYVRTAGKDTYKDGKPVSSTGNWSFAGGTGKVEGVQGGGTFTGKPDADGNFVIEVKGQYTLPAKK